MFHVKDSDGDNVKRQVESFSTLNLNDITIHDLTVTGSLSTTEEIIGTIDIDHITESVGRQFVSNTDQTIQGNKTFTGNTSCNTLSTENFTFGGTSITSDSFLTSGTQTIAGNKTFTGTTTNMASLTCSGHVKSSTAAFGSVDLPGETIIPDVSIAGDSTNLASLNFIHKDGDNEVQSGEDLAIIRFRGYDLTDYRNSAIMKVIATADWGGATVNDAPSKILFTTQSVGTANNISNTGDFIIDANGVDIPQANGSTKGLRLAGTLVTSTGSELNLLDGKTESNFLTTGTQTITGAKTFSGGVFTIDEPTLTHRLDGRYRMGTMNASYPQRYFEIATGISTTDISYIDIHSGGNAKDYDARIQCVKDPATVDGNGEGLFSIEAGSVDISKHNGSTTGLKLAGTLVTASAAELNILDGLTSSTAELNILNGATITTNDLNHLAGIYDNPNTHLALSVTFRTVDGTSDFNLTKLHTNVVYSSTLQKKLILPPIADIEVGHTIYFHITSEGPGPIIEVDTLVTEGIICDRLDPQYRIEINEPRNCYLACTYLGVVKSTYTMSDTAAWQLSGNFYQEQVRTLTTGTYSLLDVANTNVLYTMNLCDTSGGGITIQLNQLNFKHLYGREFSFKTTHTNDLTLSPNAGANLEGTTTDKIFGTSYSTITIVYTWNTSSNRAEYWIKNYYNGGTV